MTQTFPTHAMLLAAGLGERLRPLTLSTPKPLIPVAGHPLIEYNLTLLKKFGVKEVMINLHHLGEKIRDQLGDGKKWDLRLHYSEEKTILGTGGGVKKVQDFFGKNKFFLFNADILIDLDLKKLVSFHESQKALATLVVIPAHREDIKNWVYLGPSGQIIDIGEDSPPEASKKTIFSGVHLIEPEVLRYLPEGHASCIIQEAYVPLLKEGRKLAGLPFSGYWRDLGTPKRYEDVKREFETAWPYTTLKPDDFI